MLRSRSPFPEKSLPCPEQSVPDSLVRENPDSLLRLLPLHSVWPWRDTIQGRDRASEVPNSSPFPPCPILARSQIPSHKMREPVQGGTLNSIVARN